MSTNPPLLWKGTPGNRPAFAFAHGAGAPMDSAFMDDFAAGLAVAGIPVARFEFPYMAKRRVARSAPNQEDGLSRGGPDPTPVLLETWRRVIAAIDMAGVSRRALVIGGKSMGGRMASMVADDEGVLGLVCLGYPFHPPKADVTTKRIAHLATLTTPALIVQGTRDTFGSQEEVAGYTLSPAIRVHWMADGDHSFKPRKSSGRTEPQNLAEAIATVAAFVRGVAETQRGL